MRGFAISTIKKKLTMSEQKKKIPELSKALEGKYELIGVQPGVIRFPNLGEIDFTRATLEQAEEVLKHPKGQKYLKKVEASTTTKKS